MEEFINNEYHYINRDKPEKILTAGDWIYYNCNNGVHRVRLDGSGYQEMQGYIIRENLRIAPNKIHQNP